MFVSRNCQTLQNAMKQTAYSSLSSAGSMTKEYLRVRPRCEKMRNGSKSRSIDGKMAPAKTKLSLLLDVHQLVHVGTVISLACAMSVQPLVIPRLDPSHLNNSCNCLVLTIGRLASVFVTSSTALCQFNRLRYICIQGKANAQNALKPVMMG